MFTDVDSRRVGGSMVPPEWEEVHRLVKHLHGFAKFRFDYRIVWKSKTFMFDTTTPAFGMGVYGREGPAHNPMPRLIAECFDPEHACSVLRMLIVAEEDRESDRDRRTRASVQKIEDAFDKQLTRS